MLYFNPHTRKKHSRLNLFFTQYFYLLIFLFDKYILRRKIVVVAPSISMSWCRVAHNNWGDDINIFFLEKITNCCLFTSKALVYPGSIFFRGMSSHTVVSAIGSIVHLATSEKVIWGSGMMTAEKLPKAKPKKILAVRGPLTRERLVANGFDCPEVYGDPALLLPYYYSPKKNVKRYKLGIVPHYEDYYKDELQKFKNDRDVLVVKMFDYSKWTDVIDQICSCDYIVSSSLHGLVVAEAYKVPNLWVEIMEPISGDASKRFKFHDFFLSLGMDRIAPYIINDNTTKEDLLKQRLYYKVAPGLDLKPLVESCPFEIKESIRMKL